ncbi:MAG: OadG-related small transporter subunit [bacterium]
MDTLAFGLTVSAVGVLGTLGSLYLLTLLVRALKRLLPYRDANARGSETDK